MKKYILTAAAIAAIIGSANTAQAYQGADQHCREYTRTIYVGGQAQEGVGKACLQRDGSWRIVSEAQVPATLPSTTTKVKNVYIERDHYVPAHRYRYGNYYRPNSGLTISLGNHWGHKPYWKKRKHYRKYHRHYDHGHYYHPHRYHSRWKRKHYRTYGHYWH